MKLRLTLPLLMTLSLMGFTCGSPVAHPEDPGSTNPAPVTDDDCEKQAAKERSCSHCVSRPGCGWIEGGEVEGPRCMVGNTSGPADPSALVTDSNFSGSSIL